MPTATNIKIGACSVVFNNVNLGHTFGGVTLNYAPEMSEIFADQYGNTPLDEVLKGERLTVTARLAESTIANFAVAVPASTLAGAGQGRATIGKDAGYRLSNKAYKLVLHPLVNASNNFDDDIVLHKAVVVDEVEVGYNNDDERILEVTFLALIDTTKSDGNYLGHVGDSTD